MRALVYDRYAEGDDFGSILQVRELPPPIPGPHEVAFRVESAALNYNDIWGMRGKPIPVLLPHISGTDAAGTVTEVGDQVETLKVGDRVVSHGNLACRTCSLCVSGREYDCPERRVWGFQTGPLWGGFCEVTHLPEVNAVKIPDGVGFDEAAAASMTITTAWHMLVGRARIAPGQTVLVMGGGSGMGTFGIQIAKLYGCTVIATAAPDKLEKCLQLGADYAVDHRKDSWHREVRKIAAGISGDGTGIDVIFEHIGGSHWGKELTLLKYGATLVTTGATTGYDATTDLRHIFFKGTNILGATQGTRAELEAGLYWMRRGKIRAVIDSRHALAYAATAHAKMATGSLFGKILIKPQQ